MGAFAKACPDVISLEALVEEAKHIFTHLLVADLVDKNIEAIRCGYDEVQVV